MCVSGEQLHFIFAASLPSQMDLVKTKPSNQEKKTSFLFTIIVSASAIKWLKMPYNKDEATEGKQDLSHTAADFII